MKLESEKVRVQMSQEELFDHLTKVENYEGLMPESKEKFQVISQDTFAFALKGMPEIRLQIKETAKPDHIILGSTSDKFDFSLRADLEEISPSETEAQLHFEGNFNAMMAMMVKNPLKKFIGHLAQNMSELGN